MIIGRREDFIAKIRISCAAWKREDTKLGITTQGYSIFVTAFHEFLRLTSDDAIYFDRNIEDYDDKVLVAFYETVEHRDESLKHRILAYYEEHNPRAKATADAQLKMEF